MKRRKSTIRASSRASSTWIRALRRAQTVVNVFLMLQVILLVLLFMFMADRVSKLVIEQFGSGGFHLTDDEGIFSR